MTKLKDLEKRIEYHYWFHCLMICVAMILAILVSTSILNTNTDYKNPCELGLMEWENEDIDWKFINCICFRLGENGEEIPIAYHDNCEGVKRCEIGRRTCPSQEQIMVVKE